MNVLLNKSGRSLQSFAPMAEYCPGSDISPCILILLVLSVFMTLFLQWQIPFTFFFFFFLAPEEAILRVMDYKLEVICYAVKDLSLVLAVSKLVIPALVDQLTTMKNIVAPSFLGQHPRVGFHLCTCIKK